MFFISSMRRPMGLLPSSLVLITGASSGIGRSCALRFAGEGARLILTARRKDRLDELVKDLRKKNNAECLPLQFDVREWKVVHKVLGSLPEAWQAIDVLVNNAGLSRGLEKIHEGKIDDWDEMIDTNVKGLLYVSRAVIPGMVQRGKGTIVNIGSLAGHEVYQRGNVYAATKFAVDALTKGMRLDLVDTPLRVCSVDPGLVETEFSLVRFRGDAEKAKTVYQNMKPLTPDDVAEAVLFCVSRPPHVQIADIVMMPTSQASTTLVHRRSS